MRILFISNLYPPHDLGGMEIRCRETVDRLRARGHVCHVLTSSYGVQGTAPSEEGITRALHLEADIHYYRPLDFFLRRPAREKANWRALRHAIDTSKPDAIFIWGMWNLSTQVAYGAEQWLPGRVAYAVASYWPIEPNMHEAYWQRPARRWWAKMLMVPARWYALQVLKRERETYPLALEQIACVSHYVRDKLIAAGVLPHGARVIYNGIDPEPFVRARQAQPQSQEGVLNLVYVGGILPHKGVHTAIEALGRLQQQGQLTNIHLNLIGGGHPDYIAQLKQRILELKLDHAITFTGRIPREQIPTLLGNADVFLFTSTWEEPIARTVMEAMAAGLAVIGTAVGGQQEMLADGVNALVYPPDDAAQLAECILRLRQDPALLSRLAEAGHQTVLERFILERMINEIETWLKEIVINSSVRVKKDE